MYHKRLSESSVQIGEDRRLSFYAALYGPSTDVAERGRTYRESIAAGAFDEYLRTAGEVIGNVNHDDALSFAKRSDGSLLLQSDAKGLFASCYLPRTEVGEWVLKAGREGRIKGASFQFEPIHSRTVNGVVERQAVKLVDVCVAIGEDPVYPQTADEVHIRTKKTNAALLSRLKYARWKLDNGVSSRPLTEING